MAKKEESKYIPKNFNYKAFRSQMKNLSIDLDQQYPSQVNSLQTTSRKPKVEEKPVENRISIGTTKTGFSSDHMTFNEERPFVQKGESNMSLFSIVTIQNIINEEASPVYAERPRLPLRKIETLKLASIHQELEPVKQGSKQSSSNSQTTDDIDQLFTRLNAASPKLQERLSFKTK